MNKWDRAKNDKRLLVKNGYFVEEKQPWHWHVRTFGSRRIVNVWPTVGKWMEVGAMEAQFYKDIREAMRFAFREDEASKEVGDLRSGGLEYIKNKGKEK